jgi:hypothetical protein
MEKRPVDQIIPRRAPFRRRDRVDENETDDDGSISSDYFGHG